ncbi:MAG TPA: hypothetical protein VGC17_07110 [Lactovum miscens]
MVNVNSDERNTVIDCFNQVINKEHHAKEFVIHTDQGANTLAQATKLSLRKSDFHSSMSHKEKTYGNARDGKLLSDLSKSQTKFF